MFDASEMSKYLNTTELREVGQVLLDIALPGAVAVAKEAQEDGFDSKEESDLLEIEPGPVPKRYPGRRTAIDVSDYFDDPVDLGLELVQELEAAGWKLEPR